jgi:hypothetical protein
VIFLYFFRLWISSYFFELEIEFASIIKSTNFMILLSFLQNSGRVLTWRLPPFFTLF